MKLSANSYAKKQHEFTKKARRRHALNPLYKPNNPSCKYIYLKHSIAPPSNRNLLG